MTLLYRSSSAAAWSPASGTNVACNNTPSLSIGDGVLLFVAQKPSTANGGTCTTPSGFTLIGSILAAGGYSTTLGADTGNLNIFVYWRVIDGTESWITAGQTMPVTVGTNNVAGAFLHRVASGSKLYSVAMASGSDASGGASVSVTFGSDPGLQANDLVFAFMAVPTDATSFSAQALTATGVTFGTVTELYDVRTGNGNDLGVMCCMATVTAVTSSSAATLTATAATTNTNARGPAVLVRIRETSPVAITNPGTSIDVAGDNISCPVPALGAGFLTIGGWFDIPTAGASTSPGRCWALNTEEARLVYDFVHGTWNAVYNTAGGEVFERLLDARVTGAVFVAAVISATQIRYYWRRNGEYEMRSFTATCQIGVISSFYLGEAGGEFQHWFAYVGALSEAQLLEQSQVTTAPSGARSFWSLTNGSNVDSVGGFNATFTGCQSGSRPAPATAIGTPRTTVGSTIGNLVNYSAIVGSAHYNSESPFATSTDLTVVFWARLGNREINAYTVCFSTLDNTTQALTLVVQLAAAGVSVYNSNIMTTGNGDAVSRYPNPGSNALCAGWVCSAWTIRRVGGNTEFQVFQQFGEGGTMTQQGAAEQLLIPEIFGSNLFPRLNIGNSAVAPSGYQASHVRIYTSVLNATQLQAIANNPDADTSAWSDWALADGSLRDVSGHNRHLSANMDDIRAYGSPPALTSSGTTFSCAGLGFGGAFAATSPSIVAALAAMAASRSSAAASKAQAIDVVGTLVSESSGSGRASSGLLLAGAVASSSSGTGRPSAASAVAGVADGSSNGSAAGTSSVGVVGLTQSQGFVIPAYASGTSVAGAAANAAPLLGAASLAVVVTGLSESRSAAAGRVQSGSEFTGSGVVSTTSVLVGGAAIAVQSAGVAAGQTWAPGAPSSSVAAAGLAGTASAAVGAYGSGSLFSGIGTAYGASALAGDVSSGVLTQGRALSEAGAAGGSASVAAVGGVVGSASASRAASTAGGETTGLTVGISTARGSAASGTMFDGLGLVSSGSAAVGVASSTKTTGGLSAGGAVATGGQSVEVLSRGFASDGAYLAGASSLAFEALGLSAGRSFLGARTAPIIVHIPASISAKFSRLFAVAAKTDRLFVLHAKRTSMADFVYVGGTIDVSFEARELQAGERVLYDPTRLVVSVRLPDGSTDAMTYAGPQDTDVRILREALGRYRLIYPAGTTVGEALVDARVTEQVGEVPYSVDLFEPIHIEVRARPVGLVDAPPPVPEAPAQ